MNLFVYRHSLGILSEIVSSVGPRRYSNFSKPIPKYIFRLFGSYHLKGFFIFILSYLLETFKHANVPGS